MNPGAPKPEPGSDPNAPFGPPPPPPKVPDHELLRPIGRGSYGEVWLARNVMGTFRAIKIVQRRHFLEERPFEREFHGLERFEPISRSHDGFVDLLQIGRNDAEGYFYSVMELADPRDGSGTIDPATYQPMTVATLVARRQALPFQQCLELGLTISSALAFLHQRGLIHRDIKPSNIILVHGQPKLADVGMVTEATSASIAGGTLGYVAPEGIPSARADLYSLGKVLYELSTGRDRLEHPALPDFWTTQADLSRLTELNEIVLRACEPDPARRYPTAEHMHQELVLLQAGESVKRLRFLERTLRQARRLSVVLLVLGLFGAREYHGAVQARKQESQRLADVHATAGAQLASRGDLLGALPWYAAALALDAPNSPEAHRDRVNLESALRHSPRPVRMHFETAEVLDLAFDPSGTRLAEALADGRLLVRSLTTPGTPLEWSAHSAPVRSVVWSRDGRHLLSGGDDRSAKVWDVDGPRVVASLPFSGPVFRAIFAPQGDRALLLGQGQLTNATRGHAALWHWTEPRLLQQVWAHESRSLGAAFSPDGRHLLLTGDHGQAMWMGAPSFIDTRPPLWHPPRAGITNWVYDADFSPDGRWVATAALDGMVRVWDPNTGLAQTSLPHGRPVKGVRFSPDDQFLLTACDDGTARVWDVERSEEAFPPLRHISFVHRACFDPDVRRVATATLGGVVTVWDLATEDATPGPQEVFSPEGFWRVRLESGSARLFDERLPRPSGPSIQVPGTVREIRWAPDPGPCLVIFENAPPGTHEATSARLFDLNGAPLGPVFAIPGYRPEANIHHASDLSRTGDRWGIAIESELQLWDPRKGERLTNRTSGAAISGLALSPGGTRVAEYSGPRVTLLDARTGASVASLTVDAAVEFIAFSPDDRWLVACPRTDSEKPLAAQVWDAATGATASPPLEHGDGVNHAAFSRDGTYLLTSGEDGLVKEWEIGTWRSVRQFQVGSEGVVCANFDATGTRVVTAASDRSLRVWDATTRGFVAWPLSPPLRHPYNLWHARFIGNGDRILGKRLGLDRWLRDTASLDEPHEWTRLVGSRDSSDWERTLRRVGSEPTSTDQLRAAAELRSGQRIDRGQAVAVTPVRLRDLWPETQSHAAGNDGFDRSHAVSWHRKQLREALWNQRIRTARFHAQRLLLLVPEDPVVRDLAQRLQSNQPPPPASE